jgi:hypothetical protein
MPGRAAQLLAPTLNSLPAKFGLSKESTYISLIRGHCISLWSHLIIFILALSLHRLYYFLLTAYPRAFISLEKYKISNRITRLSLDIHHSKSGRGSARARLAAEGFRRRYWWFGDDAVGLKMTLEQETLIFKAVRKVPLVDMAGWREYALTKTGFR